MIQKKKNNLEKGIAQYFIQLINQLNRIAKHMNSNSYSQLFFRS